MEILTRVWEAFWDYHVFGSNCYTQRLIPVAFFWFPLPIWHFNHLQAGLCVKSISSIPPYRSLERCQILGYNDFAHLVYCCLERVTERLQVRLTLVRIDVSRIRNKKKLLGGSRTEMPSCHQLWKERGQHISKWLDIKMYSSWADEITGITEAMHAPTTAGLTK